MFPRCFSHIVILLCVTLHLVASSPAATIQSASNSVSLLLNPTSSTSLDTTALAFRKGFHIPKTHLSLVLQSQYKPISIHDTLLLLIEALFSATERVNRGGTAASGAVDIFSHRYADVQLQIVGFRDLLTPFKIASVLRGMAIMGEHTGYFLATLHVLEDGFGLIARVDTR